jgi:hypothetical protein
MANQYAIKLQDGASADIRGLRAAGTSATVQCSSTTSPRSQLTLRDTVITAGDGGANLVYVDTCALTMLGGELDIGSSTGVSVQMIGEPIVSMDRVHVHGSNVSLIGASLAGRLGAKITNSLLENVSFNWATSDSGPPGSMVTMAFNTIVGQLSCRTNSGSAYRTTRYENNIVVASNSDPSVVDGTDCMLSNNILFPFTGSAGTNLVADPQFENMAAKDYRLRATSPAVDAAMPSAGLAATTDYAGVSRPQGAKADIGAFERVP